MSRNLCRTDCDFCGGEVRLDEAPRQGTRDDFGRYYDTHGGYGYAGMVVANASCVDCLAKYLAWIDDSRCDGYKRHSRTIQNGERGFHDLSFRSTFNDEPGPEDMPRYRVEVRRVRVGPWRPDEWAECYWSRGPYVCGAHKECREHPTRGAACWNDNSERACRPC